MKVVTKEIAPYKTGKRWDRVVSKESILIAKMNVGNYTGYGIVACKPVEGIFFLGIERIGCYSFSLNGNFMHPDYVAEKLNLEGDKGNIADWLNVQLGIEAEEYGRYEEHLCIDREEEAVSIKRTEENKLKEKELLDMLIQSLEAGNDEDIKQAAELFRKQCHQSSKL